MHRLVKNWTVFLACAMASTAIAQNADRIGDATPRSPDLPLVLVVPFPAGGSADRVGNILAASLGDAMRRNVSMRNVVSGIGVDALNDVVQLSPTEIRLGYVTNTQLIQGILFTRPAAYNPTTSFEWIGLVGTFGNAIIVGPQEAATTFEQWLAALPKRDRPTRWAAGATGAMSMLAARFLAATTGIQAEIVSVVGADEGYRALRNGEIDAYFDGLPNAMDEATRIGGRIIAVTSKRRSPALPSTPSFGDHWPQEDFSLFVALAASRNETEAVRARLKSGWYGVVRAGKARAELERIGLDYLGQDGDAARSFMESEFLRNAKLMTRDSKAP